MSYRPLAYATAIEVLQGRLGVPRTERKMRLLLALLLGNAAANPLISLVSKAKNLVTAKNLELQTEAVRRQEI